VNDNPPGIRRLCVAFDVEPGGETERSARRQLDALLADACASCGLDRMLLNRQDTTEGEVALLPVGIDEPRAVAALVDGLLRALALVNGELAASARTRLKMAVHEGITILAAGGFAGLAVAKARRLAHSRPLRSALTGHPDADLAVMLSDQVFEDVGQFDQPGLPARQFRRVEIQNLPEEPRDVGWIYIPGHL
jgi:hypothetical protein